MSDKFSLPEPFKSFFGWITAILGLITAVVGFVLLWQGNQEVVPVVTLATGGIGLWISCIYIRFSRSYQTKKQRRQSRPAGYLYSKRLRIAANFGIFAIPMIALAGTGLHVWIGDQPPDKVIILVADFDGPEPQVYRVTEFVLDRFRQATQDYTNIRTASLKRSVTAQEGAEVARGLGRNENARVVVWGWYSVTNESVHVSTHIEVLDVPIGPGFSSVADTVRSGETTRPIIEARTFQFQSGLSDSITASALFATGFILYNEEKYNEAIILLTKALEILPQDEFFLVNQGQILGERALAYAQLSQFDNAFSDIDQAIRTSPPDDYLPYYNRGLIYFFKQDYALAQKDFETAINSAGISPLYMIGVTYLVTGQNQKAIEAFTQVIQKEPDYYRAYMERGIAYQELGMKIEARSDFEKALSLTDAPQMRDIIEALIAGVG